MPKNSTLSPYRQIQLPAGKSGIALLLYGKSLQTISITFNCTNKVNDIIYRHPSISVLNCFQKNIMQSETMLGWETFPCIIKVHTPNLYSKLMLQ